MASIPYSQVRKGMVLVGDDGQLYQVLDRDLNTPGNWRAILQLKLRNLKSGSIAMNRVRPEDKVEQAYLDKREMQYIYQDGDGFVFMDTETYDQITLPPDLVGDQAPYLQPEMKVKMAVHENVPVSLELPQKAILEVVETEPTIKSQTAASSYKPALLSNGVRTMVPPFVGTGTKIVVMTADGSYVERAKD